MLERVLSLVAVDDRRVPSRICGLLAQRVVTISSIQMTHDHAASQWTIQLVACVANEFELELLIKRLERLVDVLTVTDIEATGPTSIAGATELEKLQRAGSGGVGDA